MSRLGFFRSDQCHWTDDSSPFNSVSCQLDSLSHCIVILSSSCRSHTESITFHRSSNSTVLHPNSRSVLPYQVAYCSVSFYSFFNNLVTGHKGRSMALCSHKYTTTIDLMLVQITTGNNTTHIGLVSAKQTNMSHLSTQSTVRLQLRIVDRLRTNLYIYFKSEI